MSESRLDRLEERFGALLERRESGVDLVELQRVYARDPLGFAEHVLHVDLWSRQREWLLAVRDHAQVAIASAHAMGKDFTCAVLALWWVFGCGGTVLVTSKTQRQITEQFFGEIARAFRRADLPGERLQAALRVGDEYRILGFTSESASAYSGFHGARVMIVFSEAQSVELPAWDGLLSCATGREDRLVAVGNPLVNNGKFFDCFRSSAWRAFQVSCFEHPNLTGGTFIPGGPTAEWVVRMKTEWGEGSQSYASRVLARFPTESEEALCRRTWIEEAARKWTNGELVDPDAPVVLGCDPARYGADLSAVVVRRAARIEQILSWAKCDTVETTDRIIAIATRVGIRPTRSVPVVQGSTILQVAPSKGFIVCDEPGVGTGPVDLLRSKGYNVTAYNGGFRSRREGFANRRAESYWTLRQALERGEIAMPYDERLADELCSLKWGTTPKGHIAMEKKAALQKRLGRSPDVADALALTFDLRPMPKLAPLRYST